MANVLAEGMAELRDAMEADAAEDVTYERIGGNSATVTAERGTSNLSVSGRDGVYKRIRTRDWKFDPEQLPTGVVAPGKGDLITDANGVKYQVQNIEGHGCWRYCTGQRKRIRVHTQEIA